MVERVTNSGRQSRPALSLAQLREELTIDKTALDDCLMEQPDLYFYVAEGYALAVADRDAAKLDLEQTMALNAEELRARALRDDEKLTEAAISRQLVTNPTIAALEEKLLELRGKADRWQAMKEAFQQRSFMLRELVQMLVARLSSNSLERSADRARGDLGEARRQQLGELRRGGGD